MMWLMTLIFSYPCGGVGSEWNPETQSPLPLVYVSICHALMEGICKKNRASPLDKNDKDAVAVYEVVRALHRMKTGIQYLDKAL